MPIISIYVGNLPYTAKSEELKELFARYGEVSRATVIMDRETNRPRGFAFVEMTDQAEADAAVTALTGFDFQGRPLTVNCARNNVVRGSGNTSQAAMRPGTAPVARAPSAYKREEPAPNAPEVAPSASPSRGYHNQLRKA